jgi:hypothetical protein
MSPNTALCAILDEPRKGYLGGAWIEEKTCSKAKAREAMTVIPFPKDRSNAPPPEPLHKNPAVVQDFARVCEQVGIVGLDGNIKRSGIDSGNDSRDT